MGKNDLELKTDEELVALVHAGEPGVMERLLEKYKKLVLKKARALFLIGGETDDLIQEGMTGLFKAIRDFSPDQTASFATFAALCIDRQLYTAIHSSQRKKHLPLNSYVSLSDEGEEALKNLRARSPESIYLEEEEKREKNLRILQSLSPMERKVLDFYLKGYSYQQIAKELGRPQKSVDNAMQRIREKTRKEQNRQAGLPPSGDF